MTSKKYKLVQHKAFVKDINTFPKNRLGKVYETLKSIQNNPSKLQNNSRSLKGYKQVFRTRIGDYRLVYYIDTKNKQIIVLSLKHRSKVYVKLEKLF